MPDCHRINDRVKYIKGILAKQPLATSANNPNDLADVVVEKLTEAGVALENWT